MVPCRENEPKLFIHGVQRRGGVASRSRLWRSDEASWLRASDMTGQSADGSGPGYIYNARDLVDISPEKPNLGH